MIRFWLVLLPLLGANTASHNMKKNRQPSLISGITISCQGYGRVWGTDAFAQELDLLAKLGANGVSTHPYGRIHGNGRVSFRWRNAEAPRYVTRPVKEAKTRGLTMMMKPHLAYWGSPFSWRGAIKFEDPKARARFFETYKTWILALAEETDDADIFVVGTELKGLTDFEAEWRALIADVRKVTRAKLTFAANWDHYQNIAFWDALDFIGIQAYFPLTDQPDPDESALRGAWQEVMGQVSAFSERHQRKVIFTELGYNRSSKAAKEPWDYHQEPHGQATVIQKRCLKVALEVAKESSDVVAGVFLWKWFVGSAPYENFYLNDAAITEVISSSWN